METSLPPSPSDEDETQQLLSTLRDMFYALDERLKAVESQLGLRQSASPTAQYNQVLNEFEDQVDNRAERLDTDPQPSPSGK